MSNLRYVLFLSLWILLGSMAIGFTVIHLTEADTNPLHDPLIPSNYFTVDFMHGTQSCNVAPTRIIDGDTFTAATTTIISPTLKVTEITGFRLLGVDTPERREEGYQEAKDYLRKRIGGKLIQVRLKQGPGKKRDSFGRFLVDVILCTKDNLISINDEIIEKKLGKEYPR